jgi:hypothetical protein
VAISRDNGLTWVDRTVPSSVGSGDPSVGIGSDNTVYLGYINGDGRPHIAVSTDHGETWTNDWEVGTPEGCPPGDQYAPCRIQSAVFPAVVAGDGDRAAFGFLGSPTGGNYQDLATFQGIWNFYIATTYDRGAHWVTVNATAGDPVQKGAICLAGILCSSTNRNLLDFNDITVDSEGRILGAYADGCVAPACGAANNYTGRAKKAAIVRQASGRRLFAAFDLPRVVSRKNHQAAGNFDILLPLTGNPGIECRSGSPAGAHTLIFTFDTPLFSVGGATITGNGMVDSGTTGIDPSNSHNYIVNLTGVANAQTITVTLTNVMDSIGNFFPTFPVQMGVLLADVNADRFVLSGDYTKVRQNSGTPVNKNTFRYDINNDGFILSGDYTAARKQSGTQLH